MHVAEVCLYFSVWIVHIIWGVVVLYGASVKYSPYIYPGLLEQSQWGEFGSVAHDVANYEWWTWIQELWSLLPAFIAHALVKNCVNNWYVEIVYWFTAHYLLFGQKAVALSVLIAVAFCFILSFVLEYCKVSVKIVKIVVWSIPLLFLYLMIRARDLASDSVFVIGYRGEVLLAYKFMQYISYAFDYCDRKVLYHDNFSRFVQSFWSHCCELLYYAFYFPYSTMLICPYNKFKSQMIARRRPSTKYLLLLACRIVFWFVFADVVLYFVYFNSMMLSPDILNHCSIPALCAIGYFAGQWFHVKYVVLFGTYAFFAFLDGMDPPWPPICISRVSLYSRMWRYFDRGLYSFLRDYVYRPICTPPTATRKLFSTTTTFAFVCLWHGGSPAFMYWVTLNIIEIFLEFLLAKPIKTSLHGCGWKQRLSCFAHVPCTLMGILAIFFFLGDNDGDVGYVFLDRVLFQNFARFTYTAFHISCLGYCFAQCCIYLENHYGF